MSDDFRWFFQSEIRVLDPRAGADRMAERAISANKVAKSAAAGRLACALMVLSRPCGDPFSAAPAARGPFGCERQQEKIAALTISVSRSNSDFGSNFISTASISWEQGC